MRLEHIILSLKWCFQWNKRKSSSDSLFSLFSFTSILWVCFLFFFHVSLHTKFDINSVLYWRDKISNWNKQANFSKNSNKCNNTYLKSYNDITQQCTYSVYYKLTLTRLPCTNTCSFFVGVCLLFFHVFLVSHSLAYAMKYIE